MLKLGQAIGTIYKKKHQNPKILIGKDTRNSCYMLEHALSSGLFSSGVNAYFVGPLPTPGIAYLTKGIRANAGIVISASHNPFFDNGIKIFSSDGFKIPDSVELTIESLINTPTIEKDLSQNHDIGRAYRIDDAIGQYSVFLKEQFPKHINLGGLRVVIDCANGAGYKVAPKVFEDLGAEITLLGDKPNGFNINQGCGALHTDSLKQTVLEKSADIGIALDGDADRLIVIDEKGETVDGDALLTIFAQNLISNNELNKKTVVGTHMSNLGLDKSLNSLGIKLLRTNIGDRHVVDEMRKKNISLGGEQSGHLVFGNVSTTGDGILAALKLITIMLESQKSISILKNVFKGFPQVLKSINVPFKPPLENMPTLLKEIDLVEKKLKRNGANGRVLFRYSGTESKARIMVEGEDLEEVKRYTEELSDLALKSINSQKNKDNHIHSISTKL